MKQIPLRGKGAGLFALVDDDDFERISAYRWHLQRSRIASNGETSAYYAVAGYNCFMHRLVMGVTDRHQVVDHINRNGLDNRKENLRVGNLGQNLANRPKAKRNTSGYKGVYLHVPGKGKGRPRWRSAISIGQHKIKSLGSYKTKEEAALAYNKAARDRWGEFASLNHLTTPPKGISSASFDPGG